MKAIKSLLPFRKRHSKYYPTRMDRFDDLWREEPATPPKHQKCSADLTKQKNKRLSK